MVRINFKLCMLLVLISNVWKVKLEYRFVDYDEKTPSCSIDCTVCKIKRPNPSIQSSYWSVKHQNHCLKYELVVNLNNGLICWVNGPFSGSVHDLTAARSTLLKRFPPPDERILADKGYIGEPEKILTPFKPARTPAENLYNRLHAKHQSIVERRNCTFKSFKLFSGKYLSKNYQLHGRVFKIFCHIINIGLFLFSD